ncbi:MAG: hypothetical protein HOL79_07990 [Euryarchaeota archaeon]|nr:hypothetical protein [Euryarchaeota archaeon]
MQESYLAACLEAGFKTIKSRRLSAVGKCPEFTLLEKPWKDLVKLAVLETELPGQDEEGETISASPRFRRGRRRGKQQATIATSEDVAAMDSESPALRFALILVNKLLHVDQWSEEDSGDLEKELRNTCLEQGVHPVWHEMAKRCDLFGQFSACPVVEVKSGVKVGIELSDASINPYNISSCLRVFKSVSESSLSAEELVAMKRLIKRLSSGRWPKTDEILLELDDELSLISLLIAMNTNENIDAIFEKTRDIQSIQTDRYQLIHDLTTGTMEWNDKLLDQDDDELGKAILEAAWANGPINEMNPSTEQLESGLSILLEQQASAQRVGAVRWKMLQSYVTSGRKEDALAVIESITLEQESDASELLPLLVELDNQGAYDWLAKNIENIDEGGLISIGREERIPLELRTQSLVLLKQMNGEGWQESQAISVHVFLQSMDLENLSEMLLGNSLAILSHPYETLLVAHLLSASHSEEVWKQARDARKEALQNIHSSELPVQMSEDEHKLLLLLEGRIDKSVNNVDLGMSLGKNGLKAMNQIVKALSSGGSHLVDETQLGNLAEALADAETSPLGRALLSTIISKLRLNNARLSLENGEDLAGVIALLEIVLQQHDAPFTIIDGVRQLMHEFDLGINGLVQWYQSQHQRSIWALLSQATLQASQGKNLSAARLYKRAADSKKFDYDEEIMLYRKALIHLAFDRKWGEAKQLLADHPNLRAAITKRFQLYLDVSHQASIQETEKATSMLKNFVKTTETTTEETEEGTRTRTRTIFKEDELDLLHSYPEEHPKPLPSEPFTGRILAATNALQRNRRTQSSKSFDRRYRDIMQMRSPDPMEIHTLADQASESSPLDALRILERAQLSGRFPARNNSFANLELMLFRRHQANIKTSDRRYLRNLPLKPLVLVDTNIVIDALYQRIQEKLNRSNHFEDSTNQRSHFARYLLHLAQNERVDLWLPEVVRGEIRNIARSMGDVRKRFDNSFIESETLDSTLTSDIIEKMVEDLIEEFSTWNGSNEEFETASNNDELSEEMVAFLVEHEEIYDELTKMKEFYGETHRTGLKGRKIYPEQPDRKIMQYAAVLSGRPMDNVGAIIVATHDGDFTVVARAFEERFGFGIAKNSRTLSPWLRF